MDSWPTEIRLLKEARMLEMRWDDGMCLRYLFAELRRRCRCSTCRQETRYGVPVAGIADTVMLLDVVPVGNYAIQLIFDDGHDRGIYPFAYLRELNQGGNERATHGR